jgi:hypothetical protein
MEKCIFLDRFLQFPKDFRRIATFLRNKTTKDCVAFYYDSKQTVPYKGALKEHVMRRKRKGDYAIWDSSIQAAISVGATVKAGQSEEKPVEFVLPPSDKTYKTYMLHPLRRPILDYMSIDEDSAKQYEGDSRSEEPKVKSKKRVRDPLFSLDKKHTKFLRMASQESMSGSARTKTAPPEEDRSTVDPDLEEPQELSTPSTPARKAPQKWTTAEKRIFVETLEQHGELDDMTETSVLYFLCPMGTHPHFYLFDNQGVIGLNLRRRSGRRMKSKSKTFTTTGRKESRALLRKRK